MKNKKIAKVFSITFMIILLDQLIKHVVIRLMSLNESVPIIKNILYITYIQNTGAGFGLFKGSNAILMFISLVIIGFILFYFDRILNDKPMQIPIALVLGGAIGNLIDRIFLGYVIDFIDFRFWPAFNLADSSITIAVCWLMIYFWKKPSL